MALIGSDQFTIVVGLGATGLSCARYLQRSGRRFAVVDTREQPPGAEQLAVECPGVELRTGPLDGDYLCRASELVVSPGIAVAEPAIAQAAAAGVSIVGDIELFCREVTAPIIAITGSNAKSTVTTLVGDMARSAGIDVGVGGNLGTPVLDMLAEGQQALYVLELSSFQLETTYQLRAKVATVLNVSPDHLDRYDGQMAAYHAAKHRIFRGCENAVVNLDDPLTAPLLPVGVDVCSYRMGKPDLKQFGLIEQQGEEYLCYQGEALLAVSELKTPGRHNVANALSALALGKMADLPMQAMLQALRAFKGLAHRCQWVAEHSGVSYYNDTKGTNVGAVVAALKGLGPSLKNGAKLVLIAGGDGKGAAFDELAAPLQQYARAVVLIGLDGPRLGEAIGDLPKHFADSMEAAVLKSSELALPGDTVLLSPACASLDMFANYIQRGEKFVAAVEGLA